MASLGEEAAMALDLGDEWVYVTRIGQVLGRTSETFYAVNMLAGTHVELSPERLELFRSAYKKMFSEKFGTLRTFYKIVEQEKDKDKITYASAYSESLEEEMRKICKEALNTLHFHLLPFSCVPRNIGLYYKMAGDANWILILLKKGDKEKLIDDALTAYESASKAVESLSPAEPLWLAVYLTKTAFYHDVKNWPERACVEGKQALDKAAPELASLGEESSKESAEIVQLIKKNLTSWTKGSYIKTSSFGSFGGATSSSSIVFAGLSTDPGEQETPYSTTSPSSPVAQRSVVIDNFTSPGDWGYQVHEGLSENQIRFRKKAAQVRRGHMG